MNTFNELLSEWFDAEYTLRKIVENGRTTPGSHFHRECEDHAESLRKQVAHELTGARS